MAQTYDLPTFRITQPLPEVRDRLRAELEEGLDTEVFDLETLDAIVDQVLLVLRDLNDEDPGDRE